jgi:hypothetical protein
VNDCEKAWAKDRENPQEYQLFRQRFWAGFINGLVYLGKCELSDVEQV